MKTIFSFVSKVSFILLLILFQSCCKDGTSCKNCPPSNCTTDAPFGDKYVLGYLLSKPGNGTFGLIQTFKGINNAYLFLYHKSELQNLNLDYGRKIWFKVEEKEDIYYATNFETINPNPSGGSSNKMYNGIVKSNLDYHGFRGKAHGDERHKKFHFGNFDLTSIDGTIKVDIQQVDNNNVLIAGTKRNIIITPSLVSKVTGYQNKLVYIEFDDSTQSIVDIDRCHKHDDVEILCAH